MATRALTVVSRAYRATVEEQDDTVLWFTQICANTISTHVLLRGDAVNYAVRGQDTSPLTLGGTAVAEPPRLEHDLEALMAKGVPVSYLAEDLAARGISESSLIDGVKSVRLAELPELFDQYDQIWHW